MLQELRETEMQGPDWADVEAEAAHLDRCIGAVTVRVRVVRDASQREALLKAEQRLAEMRSSMRAAWEAFCHGSGSEAAARDVAQLARAIRSHYAATQAEPDGSIDMRYATVLSGCTIDDRTSLRARWRELSVAAAEAERRASGDDHAAPAAGGDGRVDLQALYRSSVPREEEDDEDEEGSTSPMNTAAPSAGPGFGGSGGGHRSAAARGPAVAPPPVPAAAPPRHGAGAHGATLRGGHSAAPADTASFAASAAEAQARAQAEANLASLRERRRQEDVEALRRLEARRLAAEVHQARQQNERRRMAEERLRQQEAAQRQAAAMRRAAAVRAHRHQERLDRAAQAEAEARARARRTRGGATPWDQIFAPYSVDGRAFR